MSLKNHHLQWGLVTRTLEEWGVTGCEVTQQLGGRDRMTLELARDIDAGDILPAFATVVLFDPTGAKRFQGVVVNPPRSADGASGEETRIYEIEGPAYYLERLTYKKLAYFPIDAGDPGSAVGLQYVSRLTLNRTAAGVPLTIAAQLGMILSYAQTVKGAPFLFDTIAPGAPEVVNTPLQIAPENEVLDLRCMDAIEALLAWCPSVACRWSYTGLTPELQFGDTIDGDFGTRELSLSAAEQWSGVARYDLLTPEVRIDYLSESIAGEPGAEMKWLELSQDISTVSNGAFGAEEMTVVLRGRVWDGTTYTAPEEKPPAGLAALLHKAHAQLFYDLSWTVVAEEVNWLPQPGERWVVSGAGTGYTTANAVAQVITRDIASGTVTFQAGAPTHLGLGQRLDLLKANRLRKVSTNAGEETYGFAAPDTDPATGGDTIVAELGVQEGAGPFTRKTVTFRGTISA